MKKQKKAHEHEGFAVQPNSVQALINAGDAEFLEKIGMTHEQAKKALNKYLTEIRVDQNYMEKWAREQVVGEQDGGTMGVEGDEEDAW